MSTGNRKALRSPSCCIGVLALFAVGCAMSCSDTTTTGQDAGSDAALDSRADLGAGDANGLNDGAAGDTDATSAFDSTPGDASLDAVDDASNAVVSCTINDQQQGIQCGDSCVDPMSSSDHCGTCDTPAGAAQICIAGTLQGSCPRGYDFCGGNCVDLSSNAKNCNGCGNECGPTEICNNGTCECPTDPIDESRYMLCDDGGSSRCVDTWTDPMHCGGCTGAAVQCLGESQVCNGSGLCAAVCPDEAPDDCLGSCIDIASDPKNCGGCGNPCDPGETCRDGTCVCATATPDRCNGVCINIEEDVANCGGCGADSPIYRCTDGQNCDQGSCRCAPGRFDCAGICADLESDNSNCESCGRTCPNNTRCQSPGGCGCPSIEGLALRVCGEGADRHCVDVNSSGAHCGDCDQPCPNGTRCIAGACETVPCPEGTMQCSSADNTLGCVDTSTDINNCGGCGNNPQRVCRRDQVCNAGSCECAGDTTRCGNGCVDTQTDPQNCGACGEPCDAGQVCLDGTCESDCGTDKSLCGGRCVDKEADRQNCGSCGFTCAGNEECVDGACTERCTQGNEVFCFTECVDITTSTSHCGFCGNVCPAFAICVPDPAPAPDDPVAHCACTEGRTLCAGRCVDTSSSFLHCHDPSDGNQDECGIPCEAGQTCLNGICTG